MIVECVITVRAQVIAVREWIRSLVGVGVCPIRACMGDSILCDWLRKDVASQTCKFQGFVRIPWISLNL